MGSKYKEKLEKEWKGRGTCNMKIKTLQIQADRNITKVSLGRCKRRYK